jgi:hypothetical protein
MLLQEGKTKIIDNKNNSKYKILQIKNQRNKYYIK